MNCCHSKSLTFSPSFLNTCNKVHLQVNFFRWRHFALPSMSLIFLRPQSNCPLSPLLSLQSKILLSRSWLIINFNTFNNFNHLSLLRSPPPEVKLTEHMVKVSSPNIRALWCLNKADYDGSIGISSSWLLRPHRILSQKEHKVGLEKKTTWKNNFTINIIFV